MATDEFTEDQLKVIVTLSKKLSFKGAAFLDAYHATFFLVSTFNGYHAQMLDKAGLSFNLNARYGYMILDIMRK